MWTNHVRTPMVENLTCLGVCGCVPAASVVFADVQIHRICAANRAN